MGFISSVRDKLRLAYYKNHYDFLTLKDLSAFNFSTFKTVVISKIDGKLGDTEVITQFIASLQSSYPNLDTIVLTSQGLKPLYEECLRLKHVKVLTRRPCKEELDTCLEDLKDCDLLVTLEAKFRFHDFYLLNKLKPRFVAGINKDVDCININLADRNPNSHITAYFEDLLKLGGCSNIVSDYVPFTTIESLNKVKEFCEDNQIAFAPWGASKHRHLKDSVIEDILKLIVEKTSAKIALLVPPEGAYVRSLAAKIVPQDRLVKVPEKINVFELASIISLSKAIISVDTANVHLACASKLPIFGIYGGNKPYPWILWGPKPGNQHTKVLYVENKLIDELSFKDLSASLESFLKEHN